VLELLLDDERTDVDPTTKLDGDTPLHLAVKLDDPSARSWMVKTLLEAGADPRIRNKYKDKPVDLLPKHATSDDLREDLYVLSF
jgi:ankyrin repeat protein